MSTRLAPRLAPTAQGLPSAPVQPRVAWGLVTSTATAMAFADGFLVVALRGVAGSIERTDHLFLAWVREALLLLPAYVAAVLVAVILTQRWRRRRRGAPHATAVLLVAISVAGTVVAALWASASAAYDYRLQQHELLDMPAMQAACTGTCPQRMQYAALALQERALGLAAVAFLVGNLVVVVWIYALRGGVLVPSDRAEPRRERLAGSDRLTNLRWMMSASLLGAALIHLAVAPEHLTEWPLAGAFFVVLAIVELGAARMVGVRRSQGLVALVGLLSLVPLVLWLVSRTRGIPLGPEPGAPEAVGFADLAACVLELVTLVTCLLVLRSGAWLRRPAATPHTVALGLTALLAVTTLGLGGSALPGVHAFGVAGHGEEQEETIVPTTRLPGSLVPPSQLAQGAR